MTRMRQRIAQRLKDSQNTYAMLTTFNEVDMRLVFLMSKAFLRYWPDVLGQGRFFLCKLCCLVTFLCIPGMISHIYKAKLFPYRYGIIFPTILTLQCKEEVEPVGKYLQLPWSNTTFSTRYTFLMTGILFLCGSNVSEMRKKHKDAFFKKHGVKLGFMSAFIKASAHALQSEPTVNAGQLVCILVQSTTRADVNIC